MRLAYLAGLVEADKLQVGELGDEPLHYLRNLKYEGLDHGAQLLLLLQSIEVEFNTLDHLRQI